MVTFFLSGDMTSVESEVDPSGISQWEESSAVLKLALAPSIPSTGLSVPSCGPLHEVFQVLPSPSTVTSVHLSHWSLSVRMVIWSDFMVGPPPKSDAATFSTHVLGVGAWVCAAKAERAKEAISTADKRDKDLFIENLLGKMCGPEAEQPRKSIWDCQRLVLRDAGRRRRLRVSSSALPVAWPRAV